MSHPFHVLDASRTYPALAGRCALAVMAKAPVPGKVKTRLCPPLTAMQAAELNACFLRDTVANLAQAARQVSADVVISYTPSGAEAAFVGVLPSGTLLLPQRGGPFGERLLATAEDLFASGFSAVCLIDSDSPTAPTEEFVRAARVLGASEATLVLGPSADGGYYLIGMEKVEPGVFERITWSTELVLQETVERARELQLPVTLLREWYDVDDAHSLARLREELAAPPDKWHGYPAPHSRNYLEQMQQASLASRPAEALA